MGLYLLVASADRQDVGHAERGMTWRKRSYGWLSRAAHVFSPRAIATAVWQMRPLTALAVVAAVALPWYVAVGFQTSGDWLVGFFGHHNVGRFAQPLEGHSGPFFYYVIAIAVGFFPWSIFLTLMILFAARQVRQDRDRMATLLVCCWAIGYIGFFSVAQTKLPNYVLPAYPALALLTAALLHDWIAHPASISRWWVRSALGWVPAVGLALTVAFPFVAYYLLPGEAGLALVGLVLLGGGIATVWLAEMQRTPLATRCLAFTAVLFTTLFFGFGAARVSQHMTSRPLAEMMNSLGDDTSQLATFGFFEPSLVFYHSAPVKRCHSSAEVDALLTDRASAFVVAPDGKLDEIAAFARGDLVEIHRRRRFLRRGYIVLLGSPSAVAGNTRLTTMN
jgi:hypothetical protein